MNIVNTVAFMLIQDDHVLAEKRKQSKAVCPGAIAIPGGHVEAEESVALALEREAYEELAVQIETYNFVCALLHRSTEIRKVNYFVVESWHGTFQNNEAEALVWIPLDTPGKLDLEVDQLAVKEYLRVYRQET